MIRKGLFSLTYDNGVVPVINVESAPGIRDSNPS